MDQIKRLVESDALFFALCDWRVTLDERHNMPIRAYNAMVERHLQICADFATGGDVSVACTIEVR